MNNLLRVTAEKRQLLNDVAGKTGNKRSQCGICERSDLLDGDVFWFGPVLNYAHSACYEEIKPTEADLIATIDSIFTNVHGRMDSSGKNLAHMKAIWAVKNELGSVSIRNYLNTNGAEKLKEIFNSFGIAAAREYASKYQGKNAPL